MVDGVIYGRRGDSGLWCVLGLSWCTVDHVILCHCLCGAASYQRLCALLQPDQFWPNGGHAEWRQVLPCMGSDSVVYRSIYLGATMHVSPLRKAGSITPQLT